MDKSGAVGVTASRIRNYFEKLSYLANHFPGGFTTDDVASSFYTRPQSSSPFLRKAVDGGYLIRTHRSHYIFSPDKKKELL